MTLSTENAPKELKSLYDRLLETFGPQHWWPAETPFEVMAGAILTQSTSWVNAARALENLKRASRLSAASVRELPEAELAAIIRPSGYFVTKARKLKSLVRWLETRCNDDVGILSGVPTAILRQELLGIWGVGPETADSILLYGLERQVFVIDAYTCRIIDRLGLAPKTGRRYSHYQALFMKNLPADPALYNEFHALLVKLGKAACSKKPVCYRCPLSPCRYEESTRF